MKSLVVGGLLTGLAAGAYAQGSIYLDNINNVSPDPAATSGGLFFIQTGAGPPTLINQDFNAAFYGGDSNNLGLIRSFSGAAIVGDNGGGPGTFLDPSGNMYFFASSSSASAFFQIQAWTGNFNSYSAAVASGTSYFAQSPVFINPMD